MQRGEHLWVSRCSEGHDCANILIFHTQQKIGVLPAAFFLLPGGVVFDLFQIKYHVPLKMYFVI